MNISNLSRMFAREQAFDVKYYKTGITRVKVKKGFVYYYIKNRKPVSKKDMRRILELKVPPAWIDVWISSDSSTPIQAIGYDKKNIKSIWDNAFINYIGNSASSWLSLPIL